MGERGAYGQRLGDIFQLQNTPALVTRTLRKTTLAVTLVRCHIANNGLTAPLRREDAYLVTVQLRDCPRHDLWIDDRPVKSGYLKAGAVSIYDLRRNPMANSISPFESLHFYMPRAALHAIADMEGCARVDEFDNNPGLGAKDPTLYALSTALLPAFQQTSDATQLMVDHITVGAVAHVLRMHGVSRVRPGLQSSDRKLGRRQEERVKELLISHLDGELFVSDLAKECGLSVGEFSRTFFRTTGMLPHQWLLQQRVNRAKFMLRHRPHKSLGDVAAACGYSSEAHMKRDFLRLTRLQHDKGRR